MHPIDGTMVQASSLTPPYLPALPAGFQIAPVRDNLVLLERELFVLRAILCDDVDVHKVTRVNVALSC